jgi:hypothetical protein
MRDIDTRTGVRVPRHVYDLPMGVIGAGTDSATLGAARSGRRPNGRSREPRVTPRAVRPGVCAVEEFQAAA